MTNEEFKKQLITRALDHAKETIALVDKLPDKPSSRVIASQLLRAATSIGANIVEAQAASSRKDFINFLNHALKVAMKQSFGLNWQKS